MIYRPISIWLLYILLAAAGGFFILPAQAKNTNEPPAMELNLKDYLQQVLQHNESVQAQMLDAESNERKPCAASGR